MEAPLMSGMIRPIVQYCTKQVLKLALTLEWASDLQ